jgi:DNA repair protein SbcD/Mre11
MSLRLLHTSDWHLGHTLHGFERAYEHERLVEWLLETIEAEAVDAVLVAGDVYDAASPPLEAQQLWYRFLVEAWRRAPRLQVVVIGGNHDSPARLDATDPFLRAMERLHVVGGVPRGGAGEALLDRLVIPLRGRRGAVEAWVAAVPFLRAADTGAGTEDAMAEALRRFYAGALAAARARCAEGQALVAMGHLYLVGTQVSSLSERQLLVGSQSAISHELFPADVAYAALGHLHLAQRVGGREHVRYAGSLLPLSFGERDYPHGAVVVELEGPRATSVRPVRAPRFVELLRVPGGGPGPVDEVLAALRRLPARGGGPDVARPLVEVRVQVERPKPTLHVRVEEALGGKEARFARLQIDAAGDGQALGEALGGLRPVAELLPEEVFRAKYARDFGGAPPDELVSDFRALLEAVQAEGA